MWATSIGSTFSQIPVPGERKSGIPEGTEIPAPVSATVQRDSRISSASRGAAPSLAAVPTEFRLARGLVISVNRRLDRLAPLPVRLALLQEGGDALLGVEGEKGGRETRSEERRVGKECRARC